MAYAAALYLVHWQSYVQCHCGLTTAMVFNTIDCASFQRQNGLTASSALDFYLDACIKLQNTLATNADNIRGHVEFSQVEFHRSSPHADG